MAAGRTVPMIDVSRWRLTRRRVVMAAAALLVIAVGVVLVQFSQARDFVLPSGSIIGGDFAAFHTAARAAAEGAAARLYDPAAFEALLQDYAPPIERYGLTWQYPPTYLFVIVPLALLAYGPGYAAWTGSCALFFFAALRGAGARSVFLFVILAAPATFHAATTGQNGFLTAGLLAIAAFSPDKRPIMAGLAAALLTVKPQLGLLIPIAYIAGGCWRAFFVAALGALALAAASAVVFGIDAWTAFLGGAAGAADNTAAGLMPLYKMATPFAAARLAGLPFEAAAVFHLLLAIAAGASVALVWRRVKDADLRAAVLCAGVFLAAPYGFYYELVILALPVAILAKRGLDDGWLRHEQIALVAAFIAPLALPGDARRLGISLGFFVALAVAASVVRRLAHAHPGIFTLPLASLTSGNAR